MAASTLKSSNELIQNYLHTEIYAPEGRFQALQTDEGLGIIFSQTPAGGLVAVVEQPGTNGGWLRKDIGTAMLARDFADRNGVKIKTFAVAQSATARNAVDTFIHLAVIVSDGTADSLYLCLNNSAVDTSWLDNPNLVKCPFDDPQGNAETISTAGLWASNSADAAHIMVDTLRNPTSALKLVDRYYIDPAKKTGTAWNKHKLAIDLEEDDYRSSPGRLAGEEFEGYFSTGKLSGSKQFVYSPFKGRRTAPIVTLLRLPGGLKPKSFASCRNKTDDTTDLYVAAEGRLFYFASTIAQSDDVEGVEVLQSEFLQSVEDLFAAMDGSKIIVWGRNSAGQVFYTTCTAGQQTQAGAWSTPVPIQSNVVLLSPYINRGNRSNDFFVSDGTSLTRMTQSANSTLWTQQSITLPPQSTTKTRTITSYTTKFQLTDAAAQPLAKKKLKISVPNRTAFYVNGTYHVLDTEAVSFETDAQGCVTLIEAVNGVSGTKLTVSEVGTDNVLSVDPTDKQMQKVYELKDWTKLKSATFVNSNGKTQNLVDSKEVSDEAMQQASTYLEYLHTTKCLILGQDVAVPVTTGHVPDGAIDVAFGDLIRWAKIKLAKAVQIIYDGVCHFVMTIGEKIYHAILDGLEKIAAAAEMVLNAIKVLIYEILQYLGFVFDWKAVTRTQKVLKNLLRLWAYHQLDEIDTMKSVVDENLDKLIEILKFGTNTPDWSKLGSVSAKPLSSSTKSVDTLDVASNILTYHYSAHQERLTENVPTIVGSTISALINKLIAAVEAEADVLSDVKEEFEALAKNISTLNLGQILEKVLAILVKCLVSSVKVLIDLAFDILKALIKSGLDALTKTIYIPVLSDILKVIGVEELSLLDMFCWLAAIPITVGYKVVYKSAPYPDDANTKSLIEATRWSDFDAAFKKESYYSIKQATFVIGHSAVATYASIGLITDALEAGLAEPVKTVSTLAGMVSVAKGLASGATGIITPQAPIQSIIFKKLSTAASSMRTCVGVVISLCPELDFGSGITKRKTAAVADVVCSLPVVGCSIYHLYELLTIQPTKAQINAVLEEAASISANIGGACHCVAVLASEIEEVRVGAVVAMSAANALYAGLQFEEAAQGLG